jgi:hypothetical protein
MQGTIYLSKNKKEMGGKEETTSPDNFEEDGQEKDLSNQDMYEAENLSKDEEEGMVWKPGFLQPEEKLEEEADKISGYQSPVKSPVEPQDSFVEKIPVEDKATLEELDNMPSNFSESFKKYLRDFKHSVKEENKKSSNPIYVDEIASKVAKAYETVRRIVDWKEEHLIRRAAIERVLKRRFVSKVYGISIIPDVKPEDVAEPFIMELIRSGYFPNGKIGKEKVFEIQACLEKYLYILNNAVVIKDKEAKSKKEEKSGFKKKVNFYNWIIEIAACEIEEILDAPLREYALMNLMTECLMQRIKIVPENEISEKDKYIQTYISVHRTLYNLDKPITTFHLLKHKYSEFFSSSEYLPEFTSKIFDIWSEIEEDLNYKKGSEFFKIAEKYDAAYLLIGDSMNSMEKEVEIIEKKVSDSGVFIQAVENKYNERLATLKKRLSKLAVFSTLSIFVAGFASLLIFEIPIAKWVRGYFSPWAIVADLAIPAALMFILVWMIRPPSGNNLESVKEEVLKIVYKVEEMDIYELKLRKKVKKFLNFTFALIYVIGGLISLYGIYWIFKIADVPWTSLYIDTANVAMVVFSAMVIRQRSKELTIVEKENIIEFISDFFSIPLAKIGGWISTKWKEYNVVSVFFIALIDFPFSGFVAMIENWRNFIKEKSSELN